MFSLETSESLRQTAERFRLLSRSLQETNKRLRAESEQSRRALDANIENMACEKELNVLGGLERLRAAEVAE